MDGIANHFPAKEGTRLQDVFLYTVSKFFSGGDSPGPPQKRRRCLDADTNMRLVWYSVPIVPVLRNDHCSAPSQRRRFQVRELNHRMSKHLLDTLTDSGKIILF